MSGSGYPGKGLRDRGKAGNGGGGGKGAGLDSDEAPRLDQQLTVTIGGLHLTRLGLYPGDRVVAVRGPVKRGQLVLAVRRSWRAQYQDSRPRRRGKGKVYPPPEYFMVARATFTSNGQVALLSDALGERAPTVLCSCGEAEVFGPVVELRFGSRPVKSA